MTKDDVRALNKAVVDQVIASIRRLKQDNLAARPRVSTPELEVLANVKHDNRTGGEKTETKPKAKPRKLAFKRLVQRA
eukprot:CAMPEP_0119512110 /NCGR_PEP_ID=MMETSP1344-20130328/30573_1 /TAXON_ID=236787 /ORGANISM="Florenciella parvula, Strain CCMP2471" /LENGTH=77 /DNA_ID=CAMNT_0007549183 /DNA_START=36 /DNA_END=265 /DNA_ORIENTATION=-